MQYLQCQELRNKTLFRTLLLNEVLHGTIFKDDLFFRNKISLKINPQMACMLHTSIFSAIFVALKIVVKNITLKVYVYTLRLIGPISYLGACYIRTRR